MPPGELNRLRPERLCLPEVCVCREVRLLLHHDRAQRSPGIQNTLPHLSA